MPTKSVVVGSAVVVVVPAGDDPRIREPRDGLEVAVDVAMGEADDAQAHDQGRLTV